MTFRLDILVVVPSGEGERFLKGFGRLRVIALLDRHPPNRQRRLGCFQAQGVAPFEKIAHGFLQAFGEKDQCLDGWIASIRLDQADEAFGDLLAAKLLLRQAKFFAPGSNKFT